MNIRAMRSRKYMSVIIWLWIGLAIFTYFFILAISKNYNNNDGKIVFDSSFITFISYCVIVILASCFYIPVIKKRQQLLLANGQDTKLFGSVQTIVWIPLFFPISLYLWSIDNNINMENRMKADGTLDEHMQASQNQKSFFDNFQRAWQNQDNHQQPNSFTNYELSKAYKTLGVSENASEADIKRAYKVLITKWHPDKNDSSKAAMHTSEINAAYDLIRKNRGF